MPAAPRIAESTITLCHRAAEVLLSTPGRHGSIVELSEKDAEDILIAADLHGNRLNFRRVCRLADLAGHPRRHLVLQEICHGGPTYPGDQGCMSHLMLEDMAQLVVDYPHRVHFLLGNHELAELTDFPIRKGYCMLNLQFRRGIEAFYGEAAQRVREAYMDLLLACPLAVRLSNGVFISHSLPGTGDGPPDVQWMERPLSELDLSADGEVFRLLWGRDYRSSNAEAFARAVQADILIHGHDPCQEGFRVPNNRQIILDCSHHAACCLLVNLAERPTHAALVQRVQRMGGTHAES